MGLLSVAAAGLAWRAIRLKHRLEWSERDRRRAADELNRRLSELFSLQELSYILSGSLQLDRIVEQVVRYTMRFLDARGALLALALDGEGGESGRSMLQVAAAEGVLAPLARRAIGADDAGLVARSLTSDRLELVRDPSGAPTTLVAGLAVGSAAAVPLRAHGALVGTLVIADPRDGAFPPEDVRLLSTVATHAAIVIANARFFEHVRHAKEQWETAFDSLSEGIAVVDEAGRVRRANRSLATMLGVPIPGVIGCDLGEALLGPSSALPGLLAAVRQGGGAQPLVVRSSALGEGGGGGGRGGRTLRVNAARIPVPAADQSVVVLVEDVTDQQAMEAHLIQSEKLAAVGQLTSIAGLSEFLLEQKELGTKDRGHLRVIHEQADRAGRIVRNLLTFAHKGPAEQAPVDLNDVIQRTLILMSYDLKLKDVTIEKHLAPLPAVLGDRRALQQVVLNLLNNAAQAVTTNPPGRPQVIHLSSWFDDRVRLRVADTGPGIPDDVLPQLFTPFFTTKEPGQGTGLGLSITYSIVEAHGGRITVERPSDGGAAFLVDLPAAPAVKRTILLVDDDPAVRRMVKALFGREGHSVEVARSGQHALDLARTRGYDLILADAQAPARPRGSGRTPG